MRAAKFEAVLGRLIYLIQTLFCIKDIHRIALISDKEQALQKLYLNVSRKLGSKPIPTEL